MGDGTTYQRVAEMNGQLLDYKSMWRYREFHLIDADGQNLRMFENCVYVSSNQFLEFGSRYEFIVMEPRTGYILFIPYEDDAILTGPTGSNMDYLQITMYLGSYLKRFLQQRKEK